MDVKAELVSTNSSVTPVKTEVSNSSVQHTELPAPAAIKQEQQVNGSATRDRKRTRQSPTSSIKRKSNTVASKTKRVKNEVTSSAIEPGAALSGSSSSTAPLPETCSRCSSALDHTGEPKVLTCACCNVLLAESAFSRSQANKNRVIKRCTRCVKAGGAPILKVIEQEPAFSGTKRDIVQQKNAERLKRAEDNLLLKTARVVPRITRRQAAALEKQRTPMTEDEEVEFAAKMRQLVYGRRAYFAQVASKSKTLMTKRELGDLDATRGRLNRLEKELVVQNQQLFDELYAVIK